MSLIVYPSVPLYCYWDQLIYGLQKKRCPSGGNRPDYTPRIFWLAYSSDCSDPALVSYGDKITPWPSIKFGSWRLWDAYVAWPSLEPERGKWNFQTMDKYVALAERAGIDLVLPLGFSPTWASTRPMNRPTGSPAMPLNRRTSMTGVTTFGLLRCVIRGESNIMNSGTR